MHALADVFFFSDLYVCDIDGLAGLDAVKGLVNIEPKGEEGRVVNLRVVCAVNEALVSLNVVADLNVGGIPDLVVVCQLLTDAFDMIPIAVALEFVAVSPDVEKTGES